MTTHNDKRNYHKSNIRSWTAVSPMFPEMSIEVINKQPMPEMVFRNGAQSMVMTLSEAIEFQAELLRYGIRTGKVFAGAKFRQRKMRAIKRLGQIGVQEIEERSKEIEMKREEVLGFEED